MSEKSPYLDIFQQIIRDGTFDRLRDLEDKNILEELSTHEQELLAILFVWRGERRLVTEAEGAKESFDLAETIAPQSALVYYWQGVAWLKFGIQHNRSQALIAAVEKLECAVLIDEHCAEAWHSLGAALTRLGIVHKEAHYFCSADKMYLRAEQTQKEETSLSHLFWDWGRSWQASGDLSGEAHDYRQALVYFEQAEKKELDEASFWIDYGEIVARLAELLNDQALLPRALECYGNAVQLAKEDPVGWLVYGRTLRRFYEVTRDDKYFQKARDCFKIATDLAPDAQRIWLDWGELLLLAGETKGRDREFEEALIKIERSESCAGPTPESTALMIQALTELGNRNNRLDLLRQAEKRACEAVALVADDSLLWCRWGEVLSSLGIYFADLGRQKEAVEKFAKAIHLDPEVLSAHFGMATAQFAIGLAEANVCHFEKAAAHCAYICERDKTAAFAYNQWGLCLLRIAELSERIDYAEEALRCFDRAMSLRGGMEGEASLDWVFNYGCALDYLGMLSDDEEFHQQAIEVFTRVLFFEPEDQLVRLHLALAWLHLGELAVDPQCYERAMEHFRILTEKDSDEEIAWDEWGCCLLGLANLVEDPSHPLWSQKLCAEAEEKFAKAIALGHCPALYHLSWLYAYLGEEEAAIHCLRRAAASGALPSVDELMREDWLAPLRQTAVFRTFLNELPKK
ncbi:MAG: hypothetical protein JSR80_00210 [Verrucomicrobia bacterium]|nr:hypothetical protein [Verrucomicrobiota bacterium]